MLAIVFCGDLMYCPYIKRYTEQLDLKGVPYKVYFWNRSGLELNLPVNYFYCNTSLRLDSNKICKLKGFIPFRKWLIDRIKNDNIDRIIALSTLSGMIIFEELMKRKQHYIFDIRDYTYEHILPFYWIEKQIIRNSYFTAISSGGFKSFLPKHDYVIAHNFNIKEKKREYKFKRNSGPIKIVWNGMMRYFDYQKQYLDALKNDERFLLIYHGDGQDLGKYKEYCINNNFTNVIFTGRYNNDDKEYLLQGADILNNFYGDIRNAGNEVKYAVSNRFYDGIIHHIPQVVEPFGFKSDWVMKSKLGINIAASDNFADKLYEYYWSIDEKEFDKNCDAELEKIIQEDRKYVNSIKQFIEMG